MESALLIKTMKFRLFAVLLALLPHQWLLAGDATKYYDNALIRIADKDFEAAIIQLKNALREDPKHLPSRILMGQSLIHAGDAQAAEKYLKSALKSGADEEQVITLLGSAYLMQGKNQELIDEVRSGSRSAEVESQILVLRAQALLEMGRTMDAADAFRRAQRLTPRNPVPLLGSATVNMRLGKLDEAERQVNEAARYTNDKAGILYALGEVQRLKGNNTAAIELFSRSLKIAPNHQQARKNRVVAWLSTGELEQAEADLIQLRESSPTDLQVTYLYAMLKAKQGKYKEATGELEGLSQSIASLKSDFVEKHTPTLLLLGTLEYLQGKYDASKMHLKGYLKIHPFHRNPRMILAEILIRERDGLGAIAMLRPIMDKFPNDPDLALLLGKAYLIERDYQMASVHLEKAVSSRPELTSARTQLVLSRLQQGDTENAVQELEQMLASDTGQPRPGMMLAQLQLRRKDFSAAQKTTEQLKNQYPGDPRILNLSAAARLGIGDLEGARTEYQNALKITADFAPVRLNLAGLDIQQGQLESARDHYESVLEHHPGDIHAMAGMAKIQELQGDIPEAITWLERVRNVENGSESAQHMLRLAELYLRDGQPSQTLEITRELERLLPGANRVSELEGLAYLELENPQEAARLFRIISQGNPHSPQLQQRMAGLLIRSGDLEGAREAISLALATDANFLPARETQVILSSLMGNPGQAMNYAQRLQQEYPNLSLGYRLAGDISMQAGDLAAATENFKAAMLRQPNSALALSLFRAQILAGRDQEALKFMVRWLNANPGDTRSHQAMATYFSRSNQPKQALPHYEKLAELSPNNPGVLNNLANLYHKSGDPRALEFARKAHRLAPNAAAVNDTLGWILVSAGRTSEGLEYLNRAQEEEPGQPSIGYHRAVALKEMGQEAEAKRELQNILSVDSPFEEAQQARALLDQLSQR